MGEMEELRAQLETERALREAADAENERLMAQVEAYAGDLGQLYQERRGRGRGGLAAEAAQLRAEVTDEAAQKQVLEQLYRRSTAQSQQLSEQLEAYGGDLAQAYRQIRRARAGAPAAWWRKPAITPILSALGGLLLGGATYASLLAPSPAGPSTQTPPAATLTTTSGPGILVGSNGQVGRAGETLGPTPDAAARAQTAVAGLPTAAAADGRLGDAAAAASPLPLGEGKGTSAVPDGGGDPSRARSSPPILTALLPCPSPRERGDASETPRSVGSDPQSIQAACPSASVAGTSPGASSAPTDLAPTVTALAATVGAIGGQATASAMTATALATPAAEARRTSTALAAAGTQIAATATAFAAATAPPDATRSPSPTTSPRAATKPEPLASDLKRCAFELRVPALPPGGAYLIEVLQRSQADVVAMWSQSDGQVALVGRPAGADSFAPVRADAGRAGADLGPGPSVIAAGQPAGLYRARLRNASALATSESRAAVFYDEQSRCKPEPSGVLEDPPAASGPDAGPAPPPPSPAPPPSPVPPTPLAPPTPSPPAATPPPATVTPPSVPTAAPVLLERPSIDCQPYLKGPYGYLQIQPIVYLDRARTLQGSRPVRATLVGPSASRVVTDAFTAAPGAAPRRLDLSGHGHYEFRLEADGADLDPNCTWGYDHDQYN